MKIKDIYEEASFKTKTKDPKYKKLAIFNYVIFASLICLNLFFNLMILIPNDLVKAIMLVFVIVNDYVVNIVMTLIMIINTVIQGKVAYNKHTILSIIISGLSLAMTITLILLQ